jgi:putative FmdB family regulatory protein
LYPYRCTQCGHRFEKIQHFKDEPEKVCPKCGGVLERTLTAPGLQFKGAGWYVNDYAPKSGSSIGSSSGDAAASGDKADKKSETKADSKTEAKSETKASSSSEASAASSASGSGSSSAPSAPAAGSSSGKD